jgi:hypothetical protein
VERLPGLGCHAEGQLGEVGVIGCGAVKARVRPARLHSNVQAWAERLRAMPEFAKEITQLRHSTEQLDTIHRTQARETLEVIAGF